jgi:hypothetical protein
MVYAVRDGVIRREPIREKGRVIDYQDVEVDSGVTDKRLLLYESEFASVLKVLAREGNILSALLRQGWDTGDLRTLTKNAPVKATGAHISVVGHITIEELLRYFDSTEAASGFGNRFSFFCVRRSQILPRGGQIDATKLADLTKRIQSALDFARKEIGILKFSDETLGKWDELYPKLSAERPGLLGSMLARAEAQVCRLAFVHAAMDKSALVQPRHLTPAVALWEYSEASVEHIFRQEARRPSGGHHFDRATRTAGRTDAYTNQRPVWPPSANRTNRART